MHYGDSHGYDKDKPRLNAWPYRDYVIRSLNENKPYSRFVLEQIAGDVQASWRLALARDPSAKESQEARDLMETLANAGTDENWADALPKELAGLHKGQAGALVKLCLTLFNLNELTLYSLAPIGEL